MAMGNESLAYNPLVLGGGAGTGDGLGFGGGGLLSGIILASLLGRNGNGLFGNNSDGAGIVTAQNIADLRSEIGTLGNEVQAAFATQTQGQQSDFLALNNRLCESEKTTMQGNFALQTQGLMNTQSIKDQSANFQVVNQENFCSIKELIHADGDATRSLINTNLINSLRDELAAERRLSDRRESDIIITNTNTNTQQQMQAQFQAQNNALFPILASLNAQVAKSSQDIINVGGLMAGSTQTANPVNVK